MTTTFSRALATAAALLGVACGGSSTPTTPTAPAPIPSAEVCGILGGLSSTSGVRIDILSGGDCSSVVDRAPILRLNLKGAPPFEDQLGSCTGTLVLPRVLLTAAHCLDEDVRSVRVWPGVGPEIPAERFVFYPDFRFNSSGFDVGLVFMAEDIPRTPVSILTSRDGRVGEPAIIAGWGRDENSVTTALRGGSTMISAVTGTFLQTPFAPPSSSVCSGDSGGPIFLSEGGRWTIAGVTSATSGTACNEGTNFYTAVRNPAVRDFILQHAPGVGQR